MSSETLDENPLRNPIYELTDDVWWEKKMLELGACTSVFEYRPILQDLWAATTLSPDTRKRIANLMLVLCEHEQERASKCQELFFYAVKTQDQELCKNMFKKITNSNLVVWYALNIAYQHTIFQQLTPEVFEMLYLSPPVLQNLTKKDLFLYVAKGMTHLPDSDDNRQKIQIWFTLCENYIGKLGSVQWLQDAFPHTNLFIFVIQEQMYKHIIFEEVCKRYVDKLSYLRTKINEVVALPNSRYATAPLEMIHHLCLGQVQQEDVMECQTRSLLFMLQMANLNLRLNGVPQCWTPIHALIICHNCVSASTDSQVVFDFLNFSAAEYDRSIRCDVENMNSLSLPSCTALELTRHMMHLSHLHHEPPSEFLHKMETWLVDADAGGQVAKTNTVSEIAQTIKRLLELQTLQEKQTGDLAEFLESQGINHENVMKIVHRLQMYKTEYLRYLDSEGIEEDLADLDAETKDHLLRLADEARKNFTG